MPGLSLTSAQASKLFGMSPDVCADILANLIEEGMLSLNSDQRYSHRLAREANVPGRDNEDLSGEVLRPHTQRFPTSQARFNHSTTGGPMIDYHLTVVARGWSGS